MEERNTQKKIIHKEIFLKDLVSFCKTLHKQLKTYLITP